MTDHPTQPRPENGDGPVARVRDLSHRFGEVTALSGITGAFQGGEITLLLGPNGCGKTTLLRLLAGQLVPTEGRVELPGEGASSTARRRRRRRHIAYLSQHSALDPEMSVGETLRFLAILQGISPPRRGQLVEEMASLFALTPLLPRRVDRLSGGQRRRLHLAAGLLQESELLLLDEPDVGLDDQGQEALWQTLGRRAAAGEAVVVVTHHRALAEEYADVAWLLQGGRLVDRGPAATVIARHASALSGETRQEALPGAGERRSRARRRPRGQR